MGIFEQDMIYKKIFINDYMLRMLNIPVDHAYSEKELLALVQMCIRDRFFTMPINAGIVALIAGIALFSAEFISMLEAVIHYICMSKDVAPEFPVIAVSYTHLDVYKRQLPGRPGNRQYQAASDPTGLNWV